MQLSTFKVEMTHKLINSYTYFKKILLQKHKCLFTKMYASKISNIFTVHLSFDFTRHASKLVNVHFKVY